MQLGVCYYPEQWPRAWWAQDAAAMAAMGIAYVRIAEFAWSRIEPTPGCLEWAWLDEALDTLHAQGLKVVLCTPTATPPKWLVDAHPEILAVDEHGQARGFGSRRHYCFSSLQYRAESQRITRQMAQRYGAHPAVVAWQTDNEYGCHFTVLSYSASARAGFRRWLAQRYGSVAALNAAWGTVFWSQEYRSFDEIDPPVGTVTEAHPAHRLDYRRFASDEVVAFNRAQVEILRQHSPGRDVLHNFMGFFTEFDHHDVARDLDVATWDSYPLGFTQDFFLSDEDKRRYARTGHPDIPAFHHDLYRGMCKGRWWVMEQQPGPVNWARWNPAPLNGMVRLWTWQAFAHGAEVVSYFRWRQAPFAQEQMHTGLQRPDRSLDQGGVEATQVAQELAALRDAGHFHEQKKPLPLAPSRFVAIIFDYPSIWMAQIQPQGQDFNPVQAVFEHYSALRQAGLDVDILPSSAALDGYALIVLPCHLRDDAALTARALASGAQVVLAPRTASKGEVLRFAEPLPPGSWGEAAGVRVQRVESLPPGVHDAVRWSDDASDGTSAGHAQRWREHLALQGGTEVLARFADGQAALTRRGTVWYQAGAFDADLLLGVLERAAGAAGLQPQRLPRDVRISRSAQATVVQNFSDTAVALQPPHTHSCVLGGVQVPPQGISVWK